LPLPFRAQSCLVSSLQSSSSSPSLHLLRPVASRARTSTKLVRRPPLQQMAAESQHRQLRDHWVRLSLLNRWQAPSGGWSFAGPIEFASQCADDGRLPRCPDHRSGDRIRQGRHKLFDESPWCAPPIFTRSPGRSSDHRHHSDGVKALRIQHYSKNMPGPGKLRRHVQACDGSEPALRARR